MFHLTSYNLHHAGVDIIYNDDNSDCDCEDICRCSRIVNEQVESVDLNEIVQNLCEKDPVIIKYCVDRILRIFKAYNPENYDISIEGGYYGQEIGKVTLTNEAAKLIDCAFDNLLALNTDKEKLLFVLGLEYAFITSLLRRGKFEVKEISLKEISEKSNKLVIKKVEKYDLIPDIPIGIVTQRNNEYIIIDGHHRIISLQQMKNPPKIIKVYYVK
jgi:hypothetical protein